MLKKTYNRWIDLRKAKRLDSWYRRKIANRSECEFISRWDSDVNDEMLKEFANIMNLPNHYIFPNDRLSILLCSPYNDLREVSAIILLEKYGICDMNETTIMTKYKYAKSLFMKQKTVGEYCPAAPPSIPPQQPQ